MRVEPIDPFANDGCTFFPEGWNGVDWRTCCDAHDHAFLVGASFTDFLGANVELARCVAAQDIWAASIIFVGVMTAGALFFIFGPKKRNQP